MEELTSIRKLESDKFYTLVGFNATGFPYFSGFRLAYMRCQSFEHYAECYMLVCHTKNRFNKFIRLHKDKQFLIWEGNVLPTVDMIVSRGTEDTELGTIKVSKRWPPFDPRYMQRAKYSVGFAPLIEHVRKIETPENLIICLTEG